MRVHDRGQGLRPSPTKMNKAESTAAPSLTGMRVLDLTRGIAGAYCTRLLAIFGAEVTKVERPGDGDPLRAMPPYYSDENGQQESVLFAYLNANKGSVELDIESDVGRTAVQKLASTSDVLVEDFQPGYLGSIDISPVSLRSLNPSLVVTSIPTAPPGSKFRGYKATELNLYAMSGLMSLVGGRGRPPLKAGGYQAQYMAGAHACALTMFAAYRSRRGGIGCLIDTSTVESATKFFTHMSDYSTSAAADEPADEKREHASAVLPCIDGHVAVTLYYFQIGAIAELIGMPELAGDPRFATQKGFHSNERVLKEEVREWLSTKRADDVEIQAQSRRLLFTKVNNAKAVANSVHLRERGFFRPVSIPGVGNVDFPGPPFVPGESPAGQLGAAPALGRDNRLVESRRDSGRTSRSSGVEPAAPGRLPLHGVRVLDLTHRLAGPTMTMVLGDWGADVLKMEWWKRMDAWRGVISVDHDVDGAKIYNKGRNWLKLNRSKRSLTLNLKTEEGKALFRELVRHCDVIADNFSAGVLDRLGLGYDVVSKINPGIIMISMPGFGSTGPHARYVSNGATIEGYAGVASMTGYEGEAPRNSVNIWPDPVAGVHGAAAIAMALYRREETGRGQRIDLSQAEVMVNMIGEAVLEYSLNGTIATTVGNASSTASPHGVYPCRGEDRWISIAVGDEREWDGLCSVASGESWTSDGRFADLSGRLSQRQELDECIAAWTAPQDAWELADRLQRADVPAAPVTRNSDVVDIEDVPSPDFWRRLEHEHLDLYPGAAARIDGRTPGIEKLPPDLGAHTDEILGELLNKSAAELAELRSRDVI